MNFEEFTIIVDEKKKSNPIWFALESDTIPEQSVITEVEQMLGVTLPRCYVDFINKFGGGYFAFSKIYSLDRSSEWFLFDKNKSVNQKLRGYILFSDNEVGDFFGFKIQNHRCEEEIYFYDHEEQSWTITSYGDLFEFLADIALKN